MKRAFLLIAMAFLIISQTEATVVIGGSTLESPPAFWENSYSGMTSGIERAFPFTTISGSSFYAEELQVMAFYYSFQSGSQAKFSIHVDENGQPGSVIGTFETNSIPVRPWPETSYAPQVLTIQSTQEIIVHPDTTYWLVGQTLQQQFNWHLADNVFGTVLYRENQGGWIILQNRNIPAFAILGSPVPEPCTLSILAIGGLVPRWRKKRNIKVSIFPTKRN